MPAGYCVLITLSFTDIVQTVFLGYLSFKLFYRTPLALSYSTVDIIPSAYPTAPTKPPDEYVI